MIEPKISDSLQVRSTKIILTRKLIQPIEKWKQGDTAEKKSDEIKWNCHWKIIFFRALILNTICINFRYYTMKKMSSNSSDGDDGNIGCASICCVCGVVVALIRFIHFDFHPMSNGAQNTTTQPMFLFLPLSLSLCCLLLRSTLNNVIFCIQTVYANRILPI